MKKLFFLLCCFTIPLVTILPQELPYDNITIGTHKIDSTKIPPPSIYRDRAAFLLKKNIDKPIVLIFDSNVPQFARDAANKAKGIWNSYLNCNIEIKVKFGWVYYPSDSVLSISHNIPFN